MALIGSKQLALMALALMTGCFYWSGSTAAEPLALKTSGKIGKHAVITAVSVDEERPATSLLGKVNLFRGVAVDEGTIIPSNLNQSKTGLTVVEEKTGSAIKAVYGGLQVSLKDNLSVMYTPGRLSRATLNNESQGLYLLTNRGGLANWFFGVESSAYSTSAESRRVTNSAQFGVIFSLD